MVSRPVFAVGFVVTSRCDRHGDGGVSVALFGLWSKMEGVRWLPPPARIAPGLLPLDGRRQRRTSNTTSRSDASLRSAGSQQGTPNSQVNGKRRTLRRGSGRAADGGTVAPRHVKAAPSRRSPNCLCRPLTLCRKYQTPWPLSGLLPEIQELSPSSEPLTLCVARSSWAAGGPAADAAGVSFALSSVENVGIRRSDIEFVRRISYPDRSRRANVRK